MIATLTKQPTNSFSLSARRYTDPWGVTRVGASTGKPDQRYCANLGHRQDDESGLTYMRARYYEATTGRFISEDPARDGLNWFAYCLNRPPDGADPDGCNAWFDFNFGAAMLFTSAAFCISSSRWNGIKPTTIERAVVAGLLTLAALHFSEAIGETSAGSNRIPKFLGVAAGHAGVFATIAEALGATRVAGGFAMAATYATAAYSLMCLGLIIGLDSEDLP